MTRDAVLKRIYHKLITEGECLLTSENGRHYKFVRIEWLSSIPDEEIEGYNIETKDSLEGYWVSRQFAPELGMLTTWLRRHFAEFGTAGTNEDHQVWKQALGL